jgi:hypothetical protein
LLHPSSPGARQANTPNGNRVHSTVASPGMPHAKPSPYAYTNGAVTSGSAHKAIKHEDPPEEDQVGHYQVEIGLPSSLAASYPTSYFHISLVATLSGRNAQTSCTCACVLNVWCGMPMRVCKMVMKKHCRSNNRQQCAFPRWPLQNPYKFSNVNTP